MLKRSALALACLALALQPLPAQPAQSAEGVETLLARLEELLAAGQPAGYMTLLSATADRERAREFAEANLREGCTRVALRERDRGPLVGTLPGDGYQLTLDVLVENGQSATLATWRLDVRRLGGNSDGREWGIAGQDVLSSVHGLYRLGLNPGKQYTARNLVVADEDMRLALPEGSVFVSEAGGEGAVTGLLLLGRGEMSFSPAPATERSQLRIFANSETLQAQFDAAFIRLNPASIRAFLDPAALSPVPVDARDFRRADEIFRQDVTRSFGLGLGDLSSDSWSLVPGPGDLVAEIHTRRFDTLTYTRSSGEVEDVSLFDRRNRRNISVYSSKRNTERYGRSYSDEQRSDYSVLDYDIEASFDPARQRIEGRTTLAIEVKADFINSLSLRLAEPLEVESVTSFEFGRLLALRVRNQDGIVVNLPSPLARGYRTTIAVRYSGVLPPQPVDREALALDGQWPFQREDVNQVRLEESYLYSNRSYWYPHPGTPNYATARLRLSVPAGFVSAASGDLVTVVTLPSPDGRRPGHQFHFIAQQPARYLGWLITPLRDVRRERLDIGELVDPYRSLRHAGVYYDDVTLSVKAQPRVEGRAKKMGKTAADIIRFYSSIAGDAPYAALTLAVLERDLPGGHSPPYMAVVATASPASRLSYRDDPASFPEFPEFFLAHELAHQWWGHGVGWKNYHEQWISEGFAQYFAALYAEKVRGPGVFDAVMRKMSRFGVEESDNGPIWLGYRVGHVKNDSRAFRAVVYDKSAAVLHMLRGLVGDDVFFRGVRRFLDAWRFRKAGTEEFRAAMEAEAGRPLQRFFERWIYGETIPQVALTWNEETQGERREAVVRVEQLGEETFDLPLQVSIVYADRPVTDVTLALTERVTEVRLPLVGRVRSIEANRDGKALVVVR